MWQCARLQFKGVRTLSIGGRTHTMATTSEQESTATMKKRIRVYTKTGDQGTSVLFNMQRKPKWHDSFHALGDVDEMNAHIGFAREYCERAEHERVQKHLEEIQARLLDVGAHIATPKSTSSKNQLERTKFEEANVETLEKWIDEMDDTLPPLRNFILPSGGFAASSLHIARAVCRRAERSCVPLLERGDIDSVIVRYLNRLSDFLFVAARYAAAREHKTEVSWRKPRGSDHGQTRKEAPTELQ